LYLPERSEASDCIYQREARQVIVFTREKRGKW